MSVYQETIARVGESPLFGFGSPGSTDTSLAFSNLGTHGQVFTLVYSYGIPAVACFAAWLLYSFWRMARRRSIVCFWASVCMLIVIVELGYYNFMPTTLHVIMVAAALAWRDIVYPSATTRDAPGPRGRVSLDAPGLDGN
jgi:hypothetical protein